MRIFNLFNVLPILYEEQNRYRYRYAQGCGSAIIYCGSGSSRAGQTRTFSCFCVFAHATQRHFADAMGEDANSDEKDTRLYGHKISRILKCKALAKISQLYSPIPLPPPTTLTNSHLPHPLPADFTRYTVSHPTPPRLVTVRDADGQLPVCSKPELEYLVPNKWDLIC